jgi:hypothetical protein
MIWKRDSAFPIDSAKAETGGPSLYGEFETRPSKGQESHGGTDRMVAVPGFSLLYLPYGTPEDWAATRVLRLEEGAENRPCRDLGCPQIPFSSPKMGVQRGLRTPNTD